MTTINKRSAYHIRGQRRLTVPNETFSSCPRPLTFASKPSHSHKFENVWNTEVIIVNCGEYVHLTWRVRWLKWFRITLPMSSPRVRIPVILHVGVRIRAIPQPWAYHFHSNNYETEAQYHWNLRLYGCPILLKWVNRKEKYWSFD